MMSRAIQGRTWGMAQGFGHPVDTKKLDPRLKPCEDATKSAASRPFMILPPHQGPEGCSNLHDIFHSCVYIYIHMHILRIYYTYCMMFPCSHAMRESKTSTHMHICIHIYVYMYAHIRTCMHTCKHYTHIYIYIHMYIPAPSLSFLLTARARRCAGRQTGKLLPRAGHVLNDSIFARSSMV